MKRCNLVLTLVLLVLFGCSDANDTTDATEKRAEKVIPVSVEVIELEDVVDRFVLPASLEAQEDIVIAAEIAGNVQRIWLDEGDRVARGDILFDIDSDLIRSSLRRDQQNVSVSEKTLQRYQSLEQEGLVSRQELENLENSLVAAREALKSTQFQLAKSQPRSPVSGHIDGLYVDRGEYVDPGKLLARLLNVDQLEVLADIPEKDVAYLAVGHKVKVTAARIDQQADVSITGKISFIAFAADDTTRTYRTKILIDNPGHLRPGMIVRVEFVRQSLKDVATVPLYALIDREGDKFIFISEQGSARLTPIVIGRSIGQRVVVLDGVVAGARVIVKGQQLLSDGVRVSEKVSDHADR